MQSPSRAVRALVAVAAALALADASIVALALPPILDELNTTVTGVAAIVGVYALVMAVAILPAERLVRAYGPSLVGALGLALFAAASVGCALSPSLGPLLAFRAIQAAGGAAGLLAAFDILDAGASAHGRRLWLGAALAGTAAGPALGGLLTQAFDWRAIFAVQAPICAAAAWGCLAAKVRTEPAAATDAEFGPLWGGDAEAPAARPASFLSPAGAALAFTSAAFTAVLFLLVLELVAGFAMSPLKAAAGVLVLPISALAASRVSGPATARAAGGAVLLAGGAASLAFLPQPDLGWAVAPQILAGAGMGLALPAFAGELLPERTATDAAHGLVARHIGIVLVLAILAPVVSQRLDDLTNTAILKGTAIVLDARLPPQTKLALAPDLFAGVNAQSPRDGLKKALAKRQGDLADDPGVAGRLDDLVVRSVQDAFFPAYLIAAALALLAALLLVRRAWSAALAAALVAGGCTAVYAIEKGRHAPPQVKLQDPCKPRALPQTGGIAGFLQDQVLKGLDRAACKYGSSREELVLAIADPARASEYKRKYGVDPRSIGGLLGI